MNTKILLYKRLILLIIINIFCINVNSFASAESINEQINKWKIEYANYYIPSLFYDDLCDAEKEIFSDKRDAPSWTRTEEEDKVYKSDEYLRAWYAWYSWLNYSGNGIRIIDGAPSRRPIGPHYYESAYKRFLDAGLVGLSKESSNSGWQQEGENWIYIDGAGNKVTGSKKINNIDYFFGSNGIMHTGWLNDKNGNYYYFETDGRMLKREWKNIDCDWYYFLKDGKMAMGWQRVDYGGSVCDYYFYKKGDYNDSFIGKLATNTMVDGKNLGPDGKIVR